jgi:hypothetical protein
MKLRLKLLAFSPLVALALIAAALYYVWCIVAGNTKGVDIAILADHMGNAVAGGHPDESISSRAGRAREDEKTWGCILCKLLDRLDPGHCARSISEEFIQDASITKAVVLAEKGSRVGQ